MQISWIFTKSKYCFPGVIFKYWFFLYLLKSKFNTFFLLSFKPYVSNIFKDTIGILQNIDLVITIDSAIAHLSGTLGIKTWLLLQYYPDWRWGLQSDKFSWYDSLKIYKSNKVSEWDSILNILKSDLIKLLNN